MSANSIQGARYASRIMSELWEKASDNLTPDDLEWFAGATEQAEYEARNLSTVLEGLACLIGSEGQEVKGYIPSGALQEPGGLAALLCFAAHSVDTIEGLIAVGSSAEHRLRRQSRTKPKR